MNVPSILKAYAAKDYFSKSNYIEVNVPDVFPTLSLDNQQTTLSIPSNYTANSNYTKTAPSIKISNCISLPLARGTTCPDNIPRRTEFLLVCPTSKIEEGYLIYI